MEIHVDNDHTNEPGDENCPENSENIAENEKYLKKLELQHIILKKLICSDLKQTTSKANAGENWNTPEHPNKTKK